MPFFRPNCAQPGPQGSQKSFQNSSPQPSYYSPPASYSRRGIPWSRLSFFLFCGDILKTLVQFPSGRKVPFRSSVFSPLWLSRAPPWSPKVRPFVEPFSGKSGHPWGTCKPADLLPRGGGDGRRQKGPEKEARGASQAAPPRAWRNCFSGSCGGASSDADRIFLGRHFSWKSGPPGNRGNEQICFPGGGQKASQKCRRKMISGSVPHSAPEGIEKLIFLLLGARCWASKFVFFGGHF